MKKIHIAAPGAKYVQIATGSLERLRSFFERRFKSLDESTEEGLYIGQQDGHAAEPPHPKLELDLSAGLRQAEIPSAKLAVAPCITLVRLHLFALHNF